MKIEDIMQTIETSLLANFNQVFAWLDKDDALLNYRPGNGGWTVMQVLEHISLTNHFLLRIINKATDKAVKRGVKLKSIPVPDDYFEQLQKINVIGQHGSFAWNRPEHMVPEGVAVEVIKERLHAQLKTCLGCLKQLERGEGLLVTTSMSVNNLGKIDTYQYMYFLARHIERHIKQMQLVENEFELTNEKINY